ncbi:xylose isomerase [Sphingomonas lenta]|uniref:Xylose isomerase n=2 Tax=Sphingomonas lenta TaxID=1141887 RepID=A0A2A2SH21_9SPHN|nr:xylose isomerase [Sphingomonas lenta]
MITRRGVLAGAAACAAGAALAQGAKKRLGRVGLQLYTLREPFAKDPLGTLERVAGIGYREVEFGGGGYEAMDHARLRARMDKVGLTAPSIHVGYEAMATAPDRAVAMARTLGARTLVVPYMDAALRTPARWPGVVADLNRFGAYAAKAGLGFAYHNHDFEFTERVGERSLFDVLLGERDPAVVKIELDLYWAVHAGQDPIALIRRLPGQIFAYHVKDRRPDGSMTSVGAGAIDFAGIFALNDTAGVRHFFVENDRAPAPFFPDVRASFDHLRALRF